MSRALAFALLLSFGLALAAPMFAPGTAHASTAGEITGGLPAIPWQRVGQWILKNALTLFMIADEIWRDLQGGGDTPPADTPPSPPPAPLLVEGG
jgi:hypothetical protein